MQVTHNGDAEGIAEPTQTPDIHPLEDGQDQLVLALDLRRVDLVNADGTSVPDLAFLLGGHDPAKAQALSFLVDSIAELLGFDPSLSRVGFTKVVDFEPGTGSATFDEFRDVVNQLTPFEVKTEQPIELHTNIVEDVVYPSDPEYAPDPHTVSGATVVDKVTPDVIEDIEAIEDIPHDLGPDAEWVEGFTLADQHLDAPSEDLTEVGEQLMTEQEALEGIEVEVEVDAIDVDGIEG